MVGFILDLTTGVLNLVLRVLRELRELLLVLHQTSSWVEVDHVVEQFLAGGPVDYGGEELLVGVVIVEEQFCAILACEKVSKKFNRLSAKIRCATKALY